MRRRSYRLALFPEAVPDSEGQRCFGIEKYAASIKLSYIGGHMTGVAISILTQRADVRPVRRERRRVVRRPLNLRVDISGNDGIARSFAGKNIGMGGKIPYLDAQLNA